MNTAEVKSSLHQLIDSIDDNVVLTKFYGLILSAKIIPAGVCRAN